MVKNIHYIDGGGELKLLASDRPIITVMVTDKPEVVDYKFSNIGIVPYKTYELEVFTFITRDERLKVYCAGVDKREAQSVFNMTQRDSYSISASYTQHAEQFARHRDEGLKEHIHEQLAKQIGVLLKPHIKYTTKNLRDGYIEIIATI